MCVPCLVDYYKRLNKLKNSTKNLINRLAEKCSVGIVPLERKFH